MKELSISLGNTQNSSVLPMSVVYFPTLENKIQEGQRVAISEGRHPNLTRASTWDRESKGSRLWAKSQRSSPHKLKAIPLHTEDPGLEEEVGI